MSRAQLSMWMRAAEAAALGTVRLAAHAGGSAAGVWWRAGSVAPLTSPLLLVSQIQRSGGTLFTRLLDGHPECVVHPHDINWGPGPKGRWPRLDPAASARVCLRALEEGWILKSVRQGYYWKGVRQEEDRHPFVFSHLLLTRIFARLHAARTPASQREILNHYFTAFFHAWLDYRAMPSGPTRLVCGFSPRVHMSAEALELFWRDYPDGYLVSVVREPSSWLASAQRHKAHYSDVDRALATWQASTQATLAAHARRPSRVCVVCFEDLVGRTDAVMGRLCEMTGLAFSPSLLQPTFNGRPVRSNSSFAPGVGLDKSAIERGAVLSESDAAKIGDGLRDLYTTARALSRR